MPVEPVPGQHPQMPPRRWVTIEGIERLTPHTVRLQLKGGDFEAFATDGPGAHIKLILPPPGETKPTLPIAYDGGAPVFPEGVEAPFMRTYTPLRFDAAHHRLEVEMVVHGDGLASTWVQRAEVGHEIVVAGPRGGWQVPQDGDWYVVAADETAIPAASQVIPELPMPPLATFFEVQDAGEERSSPELESGRVHWLHRGEDIRNASALLEQSIRDLELPPGRGYVWLACEAGAMRRIRKHLLQDRGVPAAQMVTRGYWKLGATDHPDGDYGQDNLGAGH